MATKKSVVNWSWKKSIYLNSRQKWIFLLIPSGATQDFFLVLKYSIWSVSCRNIHIMVYCAKILVRYRYMLHENEANQWITCRFSKFLIQLCKKKRFLWGFVLKYYFFGGSCRNITVPRYWASEVLCRALFRGCAEILVLGRNIHLWFWMLWFQTRSISKAGAECWELCKMHQTRFLCWPVLRIMIRLLKPFCLHIIWIIIKVKISDVSWTPGVLESLNLETLQLESRKIPKDQFSVSGYSRESSCRRFVSRVVPHLWDLVLVGGV